MFFISENTNENQNDHGQYCGICFTKTEYPDTSLDDPNVKI